MRINTREMSARPTWSGGACGVTHRQPPPPATLLCGGGAAVAGRPEYELITQAAWPNTKPWLLGNAPTTHMVRCTQET